MLVQCNAGQFTVVLGEVHQRHDDVVFGYSLGRQSGLQIIEVAKCAFGRRRPDTRSDTNPLRGTNSVTGLEGLQKLQQSPVDSLRGGSRRQWRQTQLNPSLSLVLRLPPGHGHNYRIEMALRQTKGLLWSNIGALCGDALF